MAYDKTKLTEPRFCLYIHTRPDTGEIFYVGIGTINRPTYSNQRNRHWKNIVAKNNGNFFVDVLCKDQLRYSVYQMEKALIKFFGRKDNGTGILVNQTDGGDGTVGFSPWNKGIPVSDAAKENLRIKNTGQKRNDEFRRKRREYQLGRPRSEETKAKLSIAFKGRFVSEETRLKQSIAGTGRIVGGLRRQRIAATISKNNGYIIEQIDLETGNVVNTYMNASIAKRQTGFANIAGVVCGTHKSSGGYGWRKSYNKRKLKKLIKEFSKLN